jgi:translocation and assembly module TamB
VDRLQAEVKIISILSTEIGLHSLLLEHPVIHIIVYPDGSTNQPAPPVSGSTNKGTAEDLFTLSVSHVEVQKGELLWEEKRIPLDLDARDVALMLRYSFLRRHYQANLVVGNSTTRFRQYPSFAWRGDASAVLTRDHVEIGALNVVSGKSEVHFSGRVENYRNPQVGEAEGIKKRNRPV